MVVGNKAKKKTALFYCGQEAGVGFVGQFVGQSVSRVTNLLNVCFLN